MNQQLLEKIKELIQPIIDILGYELWGAALHHAGKHTVLRIYIELKPDTSGNRAAVSLDDCSKVSGEVGAILDVENVINGSYNLEVSSPGLDRQLFTIEQYQRFIGSMLAIRLLVGEQGRRNFKGRLDSVDVNSNTITLLIDDTVMTIPIVHIDKANIIPEF